MSKGWNTKKESFVRHYGSEALDASLLLMPVVEFVGPTDPRWLATLDRLQEELTYDVLVERHEGESASEGPADDQGAFGVCSFWLVECLTRAGRLDEARLVLEKMFSYANHLKLYAEKIGYTGEALGNFPHAFTHLSLITAPSCGKTGPWVEDTDAGDVLAPNWWNTKVNTHRWALDSRWGGIILFLVVGRASETPKGRCHL